MEIDLTSLLNLNRIDANQAVVNAINEHKEPIIRLSDAQDDQGIDSNSKSLGRYKNVKYKGRLTPVDLKLTGEYRSEKDIITDNEEMVFIDNNYKSPFLQSRYGKDIMGLTDNNQTAAANILLPAVIQNINEQLG